MLLSFVIVKQTNMKYWLEIDYNIIILVDSYEQKAKVLTAGVKILEKEALASADYPNWTVLRKLISCFLVAGDRTHTAYINYSCNNFFGRRIKARTIRITLEKPLENSSESTWMLRYRLTDTAQRDRQTDRRTNGTTGTASLEIDAR